MVRLCAITTEIDRLRVRTLPIRRGIKCGTVGGKIKESNA